MRSIKLQTQSIQGLGGCFNYTIADSIYQLDTRIYELEYLSKAQAGLQLYPNVDLKFLAQKQIYNNTILIGATQYQTLVQLDNRSNYQIQLGSQTYLVNKNAIQAKLSTIDINTLLGPVLILNLAMNRVFCLHSSAFIMNNTAYILMANSGTGKSTIARYINEQTAAQRIADDILPLKIINNTLIILPDFPQLKLAHEQQYQGKDMYHKIVLLFAQKSTEATSIKQIDQLTATKKLINHSVATKLFAHNELENHLHFCHQASQQTSSYQVDYQHSKTSLQQLYKLLQETGK